MAESVLEQAALDPVGKGQHISQRQEGERKQYVRKVSKGAMGSWARSGRADPAREPGAHIEQARET